MRMSERIRRGAAIIWSSAARFAEARRTARFRCISSLDPMTPAIAGTGFRRHRSTSTPQLSEAGSEWPTRISRRFSRTWRTSRHRTWDSCRGGLIMGLRSRSPFHFLERHVLFVRCNVPDVAEGIDQGSTAIAVELVLQSFLDGGAGGNSTLKDGI